MVWSVLALVMGDLCHVVELSCLVLVGVLYVWLRMLVLVSVMRTLWWTLAVLCYQLDEDEEFLGWMLLHEEEEKFLGWTAVFE